MLTKNESRARDNNKCFAKITRCVSLHGSLDGLFTHKVWYNLLFFSFFLYERVVFFVEAGRFSTFMGPQPDLQENCVN